MQRRKEEKERQEEEDFQLAKMLDRVEREEMQAKRERQEHREEARREAKRQRKERERQKEEDKKKKEAKLQAAKEIEKRKQQEEASLSTIREISKPCPGCQRPIQKNEGCQHMTCRQTHLSFTTLHIYLYVLLPVEYIKCIQVRNADMNSAGAVMPLGQAATVAAALDDR